VTTAALQKAMGTLNGERQTGVLQHGAAVSIYLRGLGVQEAQLSRLLLRCPHLFSLPKEWVALLFALLLKLGLSAAQAAKCFQQHPTAAHSVTFEPAIKVLAGALGGSSSSSSSSSSSQDVKAGEQLLGQLLQGQPAAISLLKYGREALDTRIGYLRQLGISHEQLAAALKQNWTLLGVTSQHLEQQEAVLQQELGADRQLFIKVLLNQPRVASCSTSTQRPGVQALVKVSAAAAGAACLLAWTCSLHTHVGTCNANPQSFGAQPFSMSPAGL